MKHLLVPMIALLALAGCGGESPVAATVPATDSASGSPTAVVAEPQAAATDATTTMAQPGVQPDASATDVRALAGTWAGLLPCADCPGIDETLVLDANGDFVLTDTYRERPGAANVVRGTWSLEADGQRIRLDPGNKDDADRLFAVESDALVMLDPEGGRIDSPFDMRLVRDR